MAQKTQNCLRNRHSQDVQTDSSASRQLGSPENSVHNENQQQITYQLTTVTYGLNCSPWLSLRVLQQLAEDEGHQYPAAVETLTKGRYVDDIYGGADTEDHRKEIAWQLQGLCQAGGFVLQKWSSNCPHVLEELGISTSKAIIQFEEPITKVLGLYWHQSSDTFRFKSKQFESATITSLTWDTPLPKEYEDQWTNFRENLNKLNLVSVPRWLRLSSETSSIQIHGFADASTAAMGAVVYICIKQINEPASTVMVCAKIKIAPIKRMTIPRLELTAALMLIQLVVATQHLLELNVVDTYLWSDSSVALAWIKNHPSRWKDFIQNRVIKIQEFLPDTTWRHISDKENPADCASRGLPPQELAEHQLWWSGPEWINQEPENWPVSLINSPAKASTEARPTPSHQTSIKVNAIAELLNRYSTLAKVLQVTATLNRAIDRFRRQPVPQTPLLERDHQIPRSHPLAKLTPTLDNESIIRLGGRHENSQLEPDEIHPLSCLVNLV
ncbi:uncharacterized protein LOC107039050 [Diachasma alloeum]|uniref:uncharacterized protein LOC107039050 n=1 Tax=Diachasma alloeum TaxID=454923 RepID=UPI0007381AA7|nr:uncharacterized protein LOC107039050 [Diachasma alloeum]